MSDLKKTLIVYYPSNLSYVEERLNTVMRAARKASELLGCQLEGPLPKKDSSIAVYLKGEDEGDRFVYADWSGDGRRFGEHAIYGMISGLTLLNSFCNEN